MGKRATVSGTIIYMLDHCGLAYINEKRAFHALTWFGLLGYNKIHKESEVKYETSLECSCCGSYVKEHPFRLTEDGHGLYPDWSAPLGDYRVKIHTVIYALSKKKIRINDKHEMDTHTSKD